LASRPLGFRVVLEHLTLTTRSLSPDLEALTEGFEIGREILVTHAVRGVTGVVVTKEGPKLTWSLSIMFVTKLERGVVVLLEQQGVTAAERLRCCRVHYQEVPFMARALCVELVTVFVRRPECQAWLTALRGDALWVTLYSGHKVLVHLTGASTMLCVATVGGWPVQREVLGAPTLGLLIVRVEPQLLGLWTWTSAKYLVTILGIRPVDELPAGLTAGICILICPGGSNHKT